MNFNSNRNGGSTMSSRISLGIMIISLFYIIIFCAHNSFAFVVRQQQQTLHNNNVNNNLGTRAKNNNVSNLNMASVAYPGGGSSGTGLSLEDKNSKGVTNSGILDESNSEEDDVKVGVLLLNLGGPEKGEDVEGFLYNLFADPDIIRLPGPLAPLQSLIALIISKRRAPKSRAAYESIGGGSPILKYSNEQAALVSKSLKERYDLDVKTYVGMRYWYPFTEEALDEIQKDGINALVIVPLYPQFSISTSGSSLRVLQEEFAKNSQKWGERKISHTVVPQWYDRPGYVQAMANLIQKELDSFSEEELEEGKEMMTKNKKNIAPKHVLFSAHGVPQSYIEAGDPYQRQIKECVQKISDMLPNVENGGDTQIHLSYQSRVGPIEWLRPYTDDVLPELGEMGAKNLVVVPISFVSEHIETLEEIDIEYRELAEENGVSNWRRCPALNTDETFIEDMADMVVEALNEPSQSVTEACVANNVGVNEFLDDTVDISSVGIGGVGGEADGLLMKSQGQLKDGERINGRLAILLIMGTIFAELISGQPLKELLFGQ